MGKDNKEKLVEIKRYSFELYNRVMFNEISVQDAYNEMYAKINVVSEFKGIGRKGKNKIGLKKEMERLDKMYKPEFKQWMDEIKRLFPFTYDRELKDYTDEN